MKSRPSLAETFGLTEPLTRIGQVKMALGGDEFTPASKWGVSSLKIFKPALSVKTWAGWRPEDRLVPVTNFFNRTQTPIDQGWSVKKTQVRDFRGGTTTYDSHNGTDFAIPVGTLVLTPAAGVVMRVSSEFHRGGLKILIDHGQGLMTTSGHLARSLVKVGDVLERGAPIALSGYSGLDAIVAFPWSVPHVHFNTWLNGVPVDPFATEDEVSLWVERNSPVPHTLAKDAPMPYEPSHWDMDAVDEIIAGCVDPELRSALDATTDELRRVGDVVFMKNYFPTRFQVDKNVYNQTFERAPMLDLPFSDASYDGVKLL
ncbi:MAG: M23 family metallopeptidase [bacterium]